MAIKSTTETNPDFYADFSSLQKLKTTAKTDSSAALEKVAQQFEQMFLSMLMKSMRDANESFSPDDDVFNGKDVRFYQDMMDSQLTSELSQGKGIGLADVLVRQLSSQLGVRMDAQEGDNKDRKVSETQSMLTRAYSDAAGAAASKVIGQIQHGYTENPPSVTPIGDTLESLLARNSLLSKDTPNRSTLVVEENLPDSFDSPEEFVTSLLPVVEKMATQLGVDPQVLLAQSALETGWGKHIIRNADGSNSYNLFNIKAGRSWEGERAQVSTLEYRDGVAQKERAHFRAYGSYEESIQDYVTFLKNSPRYQQALEQADDPREYLQQLQNAGYATDPRYADKITEIFENRILAMGLGSPKEG